MEDREAPTARYSVLIVNQTLWDATVLDENGRAVCWCPAEHVDMICAALNAQDRLEKKSKL